MLLLGGLAVASVITPIMVSFGVEAGLPLVAILAYDVVDAPELIRMTVWCSIVTIVLLLPIQLGIFAVLF